jgi:hypothetical protein
MKRAFIYVGHANWGKSYALRVVTHRNKDTKVINLNNKQVRVRKMSNDDQEIAMQTFVDHIPASQFDRFILAYCPTHDTVAGAMAILNSLQRYCELVFFIQESKFKNPTLLIPASELVHLRSIGRVHVLSGNHPDTTRAARFLSFIRPFV